MEQEILLVMELVWVCPFGNGAGLGLSIVKTLVEGMAGSTQVYSKLGQGSVFTIKFPVKN